MKANWIGTMIVTMIGTMIGTMFIQINTRAWLGFLLVAALTLPALDTPPDKPLLPQATQVMRIDSNGLNDGMDQWSQDPDGLTHFVGDVWLSNRELLRTTHGVLSRYATHTETDTLLTSLQRQVATSASPDAAFAASPDAKWLLWGASGNGPICAALSDGSRREQWPGYDGTSQTLWCVDSHHWLQFLANRPTPSPSSLGGIGFGFSREDFRFTQVRFQDVNAPHRTRVLPVPLGLRSLEILAAVSEHAVIARTPNQVTSSSSDTETSMLRATQTITVWDLNASRATHRYIETLPGLVQELSISPRGDRIAWLLNDEGSQEFVGSIWVSRLDGSGLHEVHGVRCSNSGDTGWLEHLRWLPGEKAVSFVYENGLWTVPVV